MIPTPYQQHAAAQAVALITNNATARRNRHAPGTLTKREQDQCEALRLVIRCSENRSHLGDREMLEAKQVASNVKIQL